MLGNGVSGVCVGINACELSSFDGNSNKSADDVFDDVS
jgi:hypothetical protein